MKTKFGILFVLLLFLVSCVSTTANRPISEWSPKEKALFWLNIYNTEYDAYLTKVNMPNLLDAQKKILAIKKRILTEVYPPLKMYVRYVENGQIPPAEVEAFIAGKMTELETLILKEVANE